MLELLHIRNFVIVDEAHIHFHSGFSVFSGETGAGKSILIDALSLALGARAEQGFVREGAERTEITAIFTAGPSVRQWLDDQGMRDRKSTRLNSSHVAISYAVFFL